jgi:hypothetical protein
METFLREVSLSSSPPPSPSPPPRWCLASTPKLVAKCSSEMFVDFNQTTRRYVPEDGSARPACLLVNASSAMYKFGGKGKGKVMPVTGRGAP